MNNLTGLRALTLGYQDECDGQSGREDESDGQSQLQHELPPDLCTRGTKVREMEKTNAEAKSIIRILNFPDPNLIFCNPILTEKLLKPVT
jgi:hypothetical protein